MYGSFDVVEKECMSRIVQGLPCGINICSPALHAVKEQVFFQETMDHMEAFSIEQQPCLLSSLVEVAVAFSHGLVAVEEDLFCH